MSVKTKVTVPDGSSGTRRSYAPGARSDAELLGEQLHHRPRAVGPVRDDRDRRVRARIVERAERDARVVSLQHDGVRGSVEPESESVPPLLLGGDAPRSRRLADPFVRDDPAAEERPPQGTNVGDGRVDAPVTASPDRQVQHVRAESVDLQVTVRRSQGELVAAKEGGVDHSAGRADALEDELVERDSTRALGDEREHDVAAVAVPKPLAGLERLRMSVEHREIVLGGYER